MWLVGDVEAFLSVFSGLAIYSIVQADATLSYTRRVRFARLFVSWWSMVFGEVGNSLGYCSPSTSRFEVIYSGCGVIPIPGSLQRETERKVEMLRFVVDLEEPILRFVRF